METNSFKHCKTPFIWKKALLNEAQTKTTIKKLLALKPKHWAGLPQWFYDLCIEKYEKDLEPEWNPQISDYKFGKRKASFSDTKKPDVWEEAIYRSTHDIAEFSSYENTWETAPQHLVALAIKYKNEGFDPVEKKIPGKTKWIDGEYELTFPERHIWILEKTREEQKLAA